MIKCVGKGNERVGGSKHEMGFMGWVFHRNHRTRRLKNKWNGIYSIYSTFNGDMKNHKAELVVSRFSFPVPLRHRGGWWKTLIILWPSRPPQTVDLATTLQSWLVLGYPSKRYPSFQFTYLWPMKNHNSLMGKLTISMAFSIATISGVLPDPKLDFRAAFLQTAGRSCESWLYGMWLGCYGGFILVFLSIYLSLLVSVYLASYLAI